RVSKSGEVLDAGGLPICTAIHDQWTPDVAFDGTNYLVVWDDERSGADSDIYGARVTVSGAVLEPSAIPISTAMDSQWHPAVAYNGSDFVVVWQDWRYQLDSDVYGTRVSPDGTVLEPSGIPISTAEDDQWHPDLAPEGDEVLVAWRDGRNVTWDIYGARLDASGVLLDPTGFSISSAEGDQSSPAVTAGGGGYDVVWSADQKLYDAFSHTDVRGTRVSVSGNVLEPGGTDVSVSSSTQRRSGAAFDGANFIVVWDDGLRHGHYGSICAARVEPSGALLDTATIELASLWGDVERYPAVAYGAGGYLVGWEDGTSGKFEVWTRPVSTSGEPGSAAHHGDLIDVVRQWRPSIASDGQGFLLVCVEEVDGSHKVAARRMDGDGNPLGASLTTVRIAPDIPSVAVAYGDSTYLVVWEEAGGVTGYDVYAARVDTSGAVVDVGPIHVSGGTWDEREPCVAFDGDSYFVAWQDKRNGLDWDVYGARVSTSGAVLDPAGVAVSAASGNQTCPVAAFDQSSYFVLWTDEREHCDVYGTRVSSAGAVLDPEGLPVSDVRYDQRNPAVAPGPRCVLIFSYESFVASPYGSYRVMGNVRRGPTAVLFSRASAILRDGCVVLDWETTVDAGASAFIVERADSPLGEFLPLSAAVSGETGRTFRCTDCSVTSGRKYWYRIASLASQAGETYGPIEVEAGLAPSFHALHGATPNPFSSACSIRFDIPERSYVSLGVFDVRGSLVASVAEGWMEAGAYAVVWNGRGRNGSELPCGVYFCSLKAGEFGATKKILLLR
ncbi:MAG: hypothetical protein V2A71_09700, partial [Candidatus Eisenbacteria bacterium]